MVVRMTIDDEINPAILLDGPLNGNLDLSRIPDVRFDSEADAPSSFRKFLGCPFQAFLATTISERVSYPSTGDSLSTHDGGIGAVSHLNGPVRVYQSKYSTVFYRFANFDEPQLGS